jgi:copper ion binding protein
MRLINALLIAFSILFLYGGYMFAEKGPAVKRCLLKVEEMTCDKCAETVREALQKIKGVQEVRISLDKKEVEVKLEEGIDLQSLVKAVNEKGFKATLKGEIIKLNISGMHCQHCAREIKEVLERQNGVISADVSYEKKEAVVTCQPGKVTLEQLINIIEKNTEYKAKPKNNN